jgi:transcriptional regulator GlxA family with amidase domain
MKPRDQDLRITEVLQHIEAELASDISVTTLADRIHLSPLHLAHLFKNAVGQSTKAYIRERRVQTARMLLETTDAPVKQVAAKAGFTSRRQMDRAFKQVLDRTPKSLKDYRLKSR